MPGPLSAAETAEDILAIDICEWSASRVLLEELAAACVPTPSALAALDDECLRRGRTDAAEVRREYLAMVRAALTDLADARPRMVYR